MVNLGPCAMLPPHYHPRAANWVVAVLGNTTTWMQEENGAHTIVTSLTPGQATIFPAGSMHMMANNGKSAFTAHLRLLCRLMATQHVSQLNSSRRSITKMPEP